MKKKKKRVRVRAYLLSMMCHGWWQGGMWVNAYKDWRDAPQEHRNGRRKTPVCLTLKKLKQCCLLEGETIRNP
jgi:hypothetical protein